MPPPKAFEQAEALAAVLLEQLWKDGDVHAASLEQLCAIATSDEPAAAQAGSRAVFRNIVEPLGDSFEPLADALYVRFFSGVIDYCRRLPSFRDFDALLRRFGLTTRKELIDRALRLRTLQEPADSVSQRLYPVTHKPRQGVPLSNAVMKRIKTVLVPSRVTLGADIAITSVILNRVKTMLPNARLMLLGSAKAGSLFASDTRVELVETAYPRGGTLHERLHAWVVLCDSVSEQLNGLMPDEYLIVDPDSRLTQLGLLPLEADDSRYLFFESRTYSFSEDQPLSVAAGCWLDQLFGPERIVTHQAARRPPVTTLDAAMLDWEYSPEFPYVALPKEDMVRGAALKAGASGPLAAVNLGIGGNAAKRVEDPFEPEMLLVLLKEGYTLVLDRGAGDEELERTGRLIAMLESQGKVVSDVPSTGSEVPAADAFVWEGSLSGFGGLIAAANLYCGYDSAGGHLAAALGVPVIDIFTDSSPESLRDHWTPWGQGRVRVLTARRTGPRMALRDFHAALWELKQ